jgi:membrane protease YdiL (CAAX protease family)
VVAWLSTVNKAMILPDFLSNLEIWMKTQEEKLATLTDFLTTFSGLSKYLLAVVVITVIPAIGEEIIFRGLLQKYLTKIFQNPHIAIFISAFLFSAIHLQFYGFLVRFFLGLLLGYLCYFTRSLSAAILGHFVNNLIVMTVIYLSKNHVLASDLQKSEGLSLVPTMAFLGIIIYIIFKIKKENTTAFVEEIL